MPFGTRTVALYAFDKALELEPNLAIVYHNRATLYITYQEWELALADASKAIELDPNGASSYVRRGEVMHNLGRNREALSDLNTALARDQADVQGYRLRGAVKTTMADWPGAIADYDEAISLDDSFAGFFIERSWAHYNLGQLGRAIGDAKEATRLDGRDVDHFMLALYYLADGETRDPRLAVIHARRACELGGRKDWRALRRLATALLAAGDLLEAKTAMDEALQLAPVSDDELTQLQNLIEHRLRVSSGKGATGE